MRQFDINEIKEKLEKLKKIIKSKNAMAIAFSGGIDSSLLAKVAYEGLKNKAIAVTFDSDVFTQKALVFSKRIAKEIGIKHIIIKHSKLDDPVFIENSENRCYHCKNGEIYLIEEIVLEHGIKNIAYGVNKSDQNEHRPGITALKEAGIVFPLQKAGIGKPEIPQIAKYLGLPNWNMPSTTCLASRIPYGNEIDIKKLTQIEEAENFLFGFGVSDSRVRHHGDIARIEVPQNEIDIISSNKIMIVKKLKELGFKYITLDLQGYRSGSMNEVI
ncbi:MAG: ATP-dependent sacrificial sulfur transferase LarE [Desulfobacterales bacterium]|nr:ATP-dependent sacrificial sulfur transferase LarE [Desulfobacterales bacterium]